MPDLAAIAYNAYGKSRDWKVFDGSPMPRWEDQSDELKQAWDAAAQAVAATVLG